MKAYNHKWIKDSSQYAVVAGQSVKEFRTLQGATAFAGMNSSEVIYRNDKARENKIYDNC